MYNGKSVSRPVKIGGKPVIVDSNLEERLLNTLENNGFHDRWDKPLIGTNRGDSNYTPDVFLSVDVDGDSRRAIVESKPARNFLTKDIKDRMIGIAKHFETDLILLYAEKEASWYKVDVRSGSITKCDPPKPGRLPIAKLYKPLTLPAPSKGKHGYEKAAAPALIELAANFMMEILTAPFVVPKKPRYRKRRK